MTNTATLEELIARLEKSEGPETLDEEFWDKLLGCLGIGEGNPTFYRVWTCVHAEAFLDACKALQEAVLPGMKRKMGQPEGGFNYTFVWWQSGIRSRSAQHQLETHAWLIAILRALIEKEDDNG